MRSNRADWAAPRSTRFKKSLCGRTYMGLARTTYLVGPDGKVARRWDSVKVDGHAADVLRAVGEI